MTTLYRKYRPQTFDEVVGQNYIKLTLRNEIETGKIAHAYLFCGPRAVGKTTLARVFAKSINCQNRKADKSEPCNKCQSCLDITSGRNMDIIEIDAASNTGVDNVRENIIASSRLAPSNSKYKVFIIDEVHMLSTASFNALLKTMEEPPTYMVFILCTTEIHKVPATIISRTQRFDFKKIGIADVVKKLQYVSTMEKIEIADSILESIARQSQGYMRDAESLYGQVISVAGHQEKNKIIINEEEAGLVIPRNDLGEALDLLENLSKKDIANSIALVNKLVNEGVDLKIFVTDFIDLIRKMMLNKISQNLGDKFGLDFGDAVEKRAMEVGKNMQTERMVEIIEVFMSLVSQLKTSFIIQLPLEIAIVKLCQSAITITPIRSAQVQSSGVKNSPVGQVANNEKTELVDGGNVSALTNELIKERWNEFLTKIKQQNHSLSFILKVCQPKNLNGNQICLAFKYKFHKDRVDDPQIKQLIETALYEVYGSQLLVTASIDENIIDDVQSANVDSSPVVTQEVVNNTVKNDQSAKGVMDDLLNVFGGKIIN